MTPTIEDLHEFIKQTYEEMNPFKTSDDVPEIPIVYDREFYNKVIVRNLIRCGAIPKHHLEIGKTYYGSCRNAEYAEWTGSEFVYDRYKFGTTYKDTCNHFEDDDGSDLFVPIKMIRK